MPLIDLCKSSFLVSLRPLPAADPQRGAAVLHGPASAPGQDTDEQSEGAAHVRRALLHAPHRVPVLQEAAPGPLPTRAAMQRLVWSQRLVWGPQGFIKRGITYLECILEEDKLSNNGVDCPCCVVDCKFNCHKRCAYKVPNDCLGETIGGKEDQTHLLLYHVVSCC